MMRNPLSKKITGIEPSGIRKFFDLVSEMPDAISLGVGEPDFDTPWRIREEGIYTLEQGKTFYTSNAGLKDLKIEISKYLERKIHVEYDPDHEIMVTVGGSEGIDVALRAMLDQGDEVLIPQPSYVSYVPCTILADGNPVVIPLQQKNEFKLTAEELEAAITPKTKMLVMPFPNNPTGSIMTKEDLEPIAEVVKRHDLYVLSDEIYSELTYKTEHVSISSLPGMKERTLVINGFSKGFAMTGWRLGYLCAPVGIIQACVRVHQYTVTCASSFVQEAAITALTDCADDVEAMRKEYQRRKDYVVKALNEIDGISCNNPHGAFYIFVNIKSLGMTSMEVAEYLLDNAKIALVPGSAFGSEGEGYLRISYACSYEDLQEACARIKKAVEELKNK
mgnify:CR=1 FL=1